MTSVRYDKRNHPTLRRGARGDAVVRMQKCLTVHNTAIDETFFVDGFFGPATEMEVRSFQKKQRLSQDGVVGRNTWTALLQQANTPVQSPTGRTANRSDRHQARDQASQRNGGGALAEQVKRALKRKGYQYLDDGKQYHLNIVGVRDPSTAINSFDDKIVLVYRDDKGEIQAVEYPITTDPGEYYTRTKLLNKAGAAILVPGQYVDTYKLAKHRNKYEALCQRGGPVKVWRDGNRDDRLNRSGKTHEGWYGINIHRAGQSGTTSKVGRYSAGCQVFANSENFATCIGLAKKSRDIRGNKFTYTLLEKADLK
jgi:peptidoglycan hydrolase-like protein with peptidoglycan-binding domain